LSTKLKITFVIAGVLLLIANAIWWYDTAKKAEKAKILAEELKKSNEQYKRDNEKYKQDVEKYSEENKRLADDLKKAKATSHVVPKPGKPQSFNCSDCSKYCKLPLHLELADGKIVVDIDDCYYPEKVPPKVAETISEDLNSRTKSLDECTSSLQNCTKDLDKCKKYIQTTPEPPVSFANEVVLRGGATLTGLRVELEYVPVRFGSSKFRISTGVRGEYSTDFQFDPGQLSGFAFVELGRK